MEKKPEPIKKLIVITHPFYGNYYGKKAEMAMEALRRIITKASKDKGTHFIVSWSEKYPKRRALKKLLEMVPKERLHEPVCEGPDPNRNYDAYLGSRLEYEEKMSNFFIDDITGLHEKFHKGLKFAKKIDVESWGDCQDVCATHNVRTLIWFLRNRKLTKVRNVTFMGGRLNSKILEKAIMTGKVPPGASEKFTHDFEWFKMDVDGGLFGIGGMAEKLRFEAPAEYSFDVKKKKK